MAKKNRVWVAKILGWLAGQNSQSDFPRFCVVSELSFGHQKCHFSCQYCIYGTGYLHFQKSSWKDVEGMILRALGAGDNQMWSCSCTSVDSRRALSTQCVDIVDLFDVYINLDMNVTATNLIATWFADKRENLNFIT